VNDHEVTLGDDRSRLYRSVVEGLDELESLPGWFNVSTVLDVVRGPIPFSRYVVTLIEQRVEASRTSALFFDSVV